MKGEEMGGSIGSNTVVAHDGKVQIALGRVHLIPRGQGRCFSVGRFRIAVFRSRDGVVSAIENSCPHQGGPLADGVTGAGTVVCPLHGHRFRLTDGAGVDTEMNAQTFPAEVRDGLVFVAIPSDA
jgi:nitrite reductase (NADH) small subunit